MCAVFWSWWINKIIRKHENRMKEKICKKFYSLSLSLSLSNRESLSPSTYIRVEWFDMFLTGRWEIRNKFSFGNFLFIDRLLRGPGWCTYSLIYIRNNLDILQCFIFIWFSEVVLCFFNGQNEVWFGYVGIHSVLLFIMSSYHMF